METERIQFNMDTHRTVNKAPSSDSPSPTNDKHVSESRKRIFLTLTAIIIFIAILVSFNIFQRVESSLPITPAVGMSSSSFSIYENGKEGVTTAAGQVFSPPPHTPIIFKLGFLLAQHNFARQARVPDFYIQLRLSEWLIDRPSPTELWISAPKLIPSTSEKFGIEWFDFDIPHIRLSPEKQYIAWLTLGSLSNPKNATIGIKSMGPRTSTPSPPPESNEEWKPNKLHSDYPEGSRAFFRYANPNGIVSIMTNHPWETDFIGHNLHFRMMFENRKDLSNFMFWKSKR